MNIPIKKYKYIYITYKDKVVEIKDTKSYLQVTLGYDNYKDIKYCDFCLGETGLGTYEYVYLSTDARDFKKQYGFNFYGPSLNLTKVLKQAQDTDDIYEIIFYFRNDGGILRWWFLGDALLSAKQLSIELVLNLRKDGISSRGNLIPQHKFFFRNPLETFGLNEYWGTKLDRYGEYEAYRYYINNKDYYSLSTTGVIREHSCGKTRECGNLLDIKNVREHFNIYEILLNKSNILPFFASKHRVLSYIIGNHIKDKIGIDVELFVEDDINYGYITTIDKIEGNKLVYVIMEDEFITRQKETGTILLDKNDILNEIIKVRAKNVLLGKELKKDCALIYINGNLEIIRYRLI